MNNRKLRFISAFLSFALIFTTIIPALAFAETNEGDAKMMVEQITVDNEINPLGIDNKTPYFAWISSSTTRSSYQTAYRIVVADSEEGLNNGNYIWDTDKVMSDVSTGVAYDGPSLESQKR